MVIFIFIFCGPTVALYGPFYFIFLRAYGSQKIKIKMIIKGYGSAATLNGDVAERFAYAIKMVDCVFKNTLH